jgi:predicted transcriptional regulator
MSKPRQTHVGCQRGLGKRRKSVGLTQHQLSRETGIAVGRIVFAETGRVDLEPFEVEKIQSVLKKRAQKALDAVR